MEKDTNVIFRVNSTLKENVTNIAKENGVTMSDIITACLKDIEHRKMVPINLQKYLPQKHQSLISIPLIKLYLNEIIRKQNKQLIKKAYLFGSYARGEETPKSDIDIRLEVEKGFSLIEIGNIRQDLVDLTGKDVDLLVIDPLKLDQDFYNKIRKEEICLYERSWSI